MQTSNNSKIPGIQEVGEKSDWVGTLEAKVPDLAKSAVKNTLESEPSIEARIQAWETLIETYTWTSQYNDTLEITHEWINIKWVGKFALNDSRSTSYDNAKTTGTLDRLPKFSIFNNLRSFIEGMTSSDQIIFFRDVMNMNGFNEFYITSDLNWLGAVHGLIIEPAGLYTSDICGTHEQSLVRFAE
jgi:hypothetical protein